MGETKINLKKPVYFGQAILDLSKTIMYQLYYDYMEPKYGGKIKLCYWGKESFVYEIKIKVFYKDITEDVEARFDTSGFSKDDNRSKPTGKNNKVIKMMKDDLLEKSWHSLLHWGLRRMRIESQTKVER